MTDQVLLHEYLEHRSETAFRELVRRHIDLVYSAALRQSGGRTDLAADITQMVFAALARKAVFLTGHTALRGWLYTCTRHLAARTMRGENRRVVRERQAQFMNDPSPSAGAIWDSIRPVLDEVLNALGAADREIVLLRFFDGRPLAEIGRQLRITENAAGKRVDRALERVRSLLQKRGIASTGAAIGIALANQVVTAAPAGLATNIGSAALAAESSAALGIFAFTTAAKSVFLSGAFLGVISLCAVATLGLGAYLTAQLRQEQANAVARQQAVAGAENRLHAAESTMHAGGHAIRGPRSAPAERPRKHRTRLRRSMPGSRRTWN